MKKVIYKGNLNQIKQRPAENALIVAIRNGKSLLIQNLDHTAGKVEWDGERVIFSYALADGECLVVQDEAGIAPKETL